MQLNSGVRRMLTTFSHNRVTSVHRIFVMAVVMLATAGCRARTHVLPEPADCTYCWWTSQYVGVAPVWVAFRFQQALDSLGFTNPRVGRDADSAWAFADPTPVPRTANSAYGFRVVVFPAADSTNCGWRGTADAPVARAPAGALSGFHTTLLIFPKGRPWPSHDSVAAGSRGVSLCADVYRLALAGLERLQ
jgi:hypothetical protein